MFTAYDWMKPARKQNNFQKDLGEFSRSEKMTNLVARARDPLWEESWGSGKKPKRMHGIHCIPLLSDPVH